MLALASFHPISAFPVEDAVARPLAAVASTALLTRWFRNRTLTPFGVNCVVFSLATVPYNA